MSTSSNTPMKMSGKGYRHTKIVTAQGIRDRRIRLSLSVAKMFFRVQDMLGYDKGSNTIDWLLSKSNAAMEELYTKHNLPPIEHRVVEAVQEECSPKSEEDINKKKVISKSRVLYNRHNAKESRNMGRARARERTREKMKNQSKLLYESNSTNKSFDQPVSSINFYDSLDGLFLEGGCHPPRDNIFENIGTFDDFTNLIQMDSHQMYSLGNNDVLIEPHGIGCSYNINSVMGSLENWGTNGVGMNTSSSGEINNTLSSPGDNQTPIWCPPSSSSFPFSLPY